MGVRIKLKEALAKRGFDHRDVAENYLEKSSGAFYILEGRSNSIKLTDLAMLLDLLGGSAALLEIFEYEPAKNNKANNYRKSVAQQVMKKIERETRVLKMLGNDQDRKTSQI